MTSCPICGGAQTVSLFRGSDRLYRTTTDEFAVVRCAQCGFAQPAALPSLPGYFDRMYDQRWADEWIRTEHDATYKDAVFADVSSLQAEFVRHQPGVAPDGATVEEPFVTLDWTFVLAAEADAK